MSLLNLAYALREIVGIPDPNSNGTILATVVAIIFDGGDPQYRVSWMINMESHYEELPEWRLQKVDPPESMQKEQYDKLKPSIALPLDNR